MLHAQNLFRINASYQYQVHTSFNYGYTSISTDDGGYIIAGRSDSSFIKSNIYIIKIKYNGELAWTKLINIKSNNTQLPVTIIKTSDGGFAIGTTAGNKATILKFDRNNTLAWSRTNEDEYKTEVYGFTGSDGGSMANGADKNIVSVYPNPATDKIILHFNAVTAQSFSITISNSNGMPVKQLNNVLANAKSNIIIPATNLPGGIYFIHITGNSSTQVIKVLKE